MKQVVYDILTIWWLELSVLTQAGIVNTWKAAWLGVSIMLGKPAAKGLKTLHNNNLNWIPPVLSSLITLGHFQGRRRVHSC